MTTDEAIKWAGGKQVHLALRLGVKPPSVSEWVRLGYPSHEAQLKLYIISGGALKPEPGIIPPPMIVAPHDGHRTTKAPKGIVEPTGGSK